jgi:type IV pilus assembly protein PilA
MPRIRRAGGFTLVELMIVVALIGVLAAIAIPSFLTYQARSRRSEAYANLSAIARMQKSYHAVKDEFYASGDSYPDPAGYNGGLLGTAKMPWDAASQAAFSGLGWQPDGQVFYSYETTTPADPILGSCDACTFCFTATAYGDVDGDGNVSAVMYVHPESSGGGPLDCSSGTVIFTAPVRMGTGAPVYNEVAINRSIDEY